MRRIIVAFFILYQFLPICYDGLDFGGVQTAEAQSMAMELDEVVVIGHQDGDEDDGSDLLDDFEDIAGIGHNEYNEDDYGTNDSDDSSYNQGEEWNQFDDDDDLVLIPYDLPYAWRKVDQGFECVVTSMEYVMNILERNKPSKDLYRYYIEEIYKSVNSKYDPNYNGVSYGDRKELFSRVFEIEEITNNNDLVKLPTYGKPVLTVIDGIYEGKPCYHEIVLVGYRNTRSQCYYIDPSSGRYNFISPQNIIGPSYLIKSITNTIIIK